MCENSGTIIVSRIVLSPCVLEKTNNFDNEKTKNEIKRDIKKVIKSAYDDAFFTNKDHKVVEKDFSSTSVEYYDGCIVLEIVQVISALSPFYKYIPKTTRDKLTKSIEKKIDPFLKKTQPRYGRSEMYHIADN